MKANFKEIMSENFGAELTASQLWALTKLAKNVRLRCRNNAAFNNFMNATFPYANFRQVNKTRVNRFSGLQESYPGLQITLKGQVSDEPEDQD
jgi:hypothetical protein